MSSVHDQVSKQFYAWEARGRGWRVFDGPVDPEPPFEPFVGYSLAPAIDDGRKPTALSSFIARLSRSLAKERPIIAEPPESDPEPEPSPLVREEELVELQTTLPAGLNIPREVFEAFLSNLSVCVGPLTFELVGTSNKITAQFACHPHDAPLIRRQLNAYFPEASFLPAGGSLSSFAGEDEYCAIVDFGLCREFLYPIASGKIDPFIGLTGALSELREGESAVCQVIFQPCRNAWTEAILNHVADPIGKPVFVNHPEFVGLAEAKTSKPLYAVLLRIAAKSETFDGSWEILRNLAGALRVFAHPNGNELIPLENDEYPFEAHLEDLLRRQTRRTGMLLNADELIGLVHLPSAAIRGNKFSRQATNTKAAPHLVLRSRGLVLGENIHAGERKMVRLNSDQRTKHMHVIGASGTGKSTLLFNLIKQDIENGEGIGVLDPHGDLIDKILGSIPPHRVNDVVLVDPSDEDCSVGFNLLSAHSDSEKRILASDLVSVFQRLSTSWGDQLGSVLNNAILAFLESTQGGTLADLQRFLIEPAFRKDFLHTVQDTQVLYYWEKVFPQLTGNKSIGPVLTRLGTFLDRKPIRYMVTQKQNRLDFADIMNTGKIFLAKLSQGEIGNENAYLLGSFLVSKFQQLAMSRQGQAASTRRDFWLYVDEFSNFITPSMAQILSGARKYRLGLILAHQEMRQMQRDPEVGSAVLSNCFTRIVFRIGDADARTLESGFSSFTAKDLQNLGTGEAIVRVERSDCDFNLSVPPSEEPSADEAAKRRDEVIAASRQRYATSRKIIEAEALREFQEASRVQPKQAPGKAQPQAEPSKPAHPSSEESTDQQSKPQKKTESPKFSSAEIPKEETRITKDAFEKAASAPPEGEQTSGTPVPAHQALKEKIADFARSLGYVCTAEKRGADSLERIDLLLERGQESIACEVSFTTPIENELAHVRNCLRSGHKHIAMICEDPKRLTRIQKLVSTSLLQGELARVAFYHPAEFLIRLREWNADAKLSGPAKQTIRISAKLTREERQSREAVYLAQLRENMRKEKG